MLKLTKEQKKQIEKIGKKYNFKLLLLHGSYVTGRNTKESDLDLAFLAQRKPDFKTLLEIQSDLETVFGHDYKRELDVKPINGADPLFAYQIAKYSQLLYGEGLDYNEFRAYAFKRFMDAKDLFRLEKILIDKYQNYLNKTYA